MLVFLIEPLMLERKSIFANRDDDNLKTLNLILNRNQDEKDEFIKQTINQQLIKKNELEALIKKTDELRNESHNLDNPDQLNKLSENVDFLVNQLKDFKSYEDEMRNYVEASLKENDELKKKSEQIEQEITCLNDKKTEIGSKIKEYAHSVDEVNYYIQRDKQVQIEIQKLNEELKRTRQEYFQEKLKQDELFDSLRTLFFKLASIIRNFENDLPDAQHLNECLRNEQYQDLIQFLNNPELENNSKFSLDLYTEFLKSLKQSLNNDLLLCKEEICKRQGELESSLNRIKQLNKKNESIVEQKQNVIQNIEQTKLVSI